MSLESQRSPIDLLTNALYVGAGLLLAYALLAWLISRPAFALHHLEVRGELAHVSESQIRFLSSRNIRGNFFTVDLEKVRAEFEKLPWVREARVTRHWPDRLVLELYEHQPLGSWNGSQLVSDRGEVFNVRPGAGLPSLGGIEGSGPDVVAAYRKFGAVLAPLGLSVKEISYSSRRAWRMKVQGAETEIEFALGRSDVEPRLARFAAQYEKLVNQLGAAPKYVDLRYADGFALKRGEPIAQAQAVNLNGHREI